MLRAADVRFSYGRDCVLDGVSIAATPGTLVGVLGPNGSGKTTLLRLLAGSLSPDEGRITLDDRPIDTIPKRLLARRVAVVPQHTHPAFDYRVIELVLMGRYPHLGAFELEGPEDEAIAMAALEATGTAHLADRPFSTLSGGEQQRVVIASALAQVHEAGTRTPTRPEGGAVLLLDEPTASLDLRYQLQVAGVLRQLTGERRLGIVLSTHDLTFAASICHEIVLLSRGHVVDAGPTDRVLTPEAVRRVYGVEADVWRHGRTGHLAVVPLGLSLQ